MLSDVYFISKSKYPRGHPSDVDILQTAQENNARLNLTGCLIRGQDWFAQSLEGRTPDVRRVFETILRDERHTDIQFWERRGFKSRAFPLWRVIMADTDSYAARLLPTLRDESVHEEFKRRAVQAVFKRHTAAFALQSEKDEVDANDAITRREPPQY